jgi:hypothetical protein
MSIRLIKTHRYEFSGETITLINAFAHIHQYDNLKAYKESWVAWLKIHAELIETEIVRVLRLGYIGDVADKMFKAGRYYFRKKVSSSNTKEPSSRCEYSRMSSAVLVAMDKHIHAALSACKADGGGEDDDEEITPASGYNSFCSENVELLTHEIKLLYNKNGRLDAGLLAAKIKKTYKNRYYRITSDIISAAVEKRDKNN